MATIDKDACRELYDEVRNDDTETTWAVFKYEGKAIVAGGCGVDYDEFKKMCTEDARLFGYIRFTTGDAMSKRAKFTLITWIGENVGGFQRGSVSTDKTVVKDIVQNIAKEFQLSDPKELEASHIIEELKKAGGANYDAQCE